MKESINPRIKPLDQITAADESVCGGKAYNCARLRQAGFPVPDGIVVVTTATDDDVAEITSHQWFDRLTAEELFAVRSSGIGEDGGQQSFAGIHQTFLNVATRDLSRAVAECQASGRSHQALEYRRANRMSTDTIQMGVLIQRMILALDRTAAELAGSQRAKKMTRRAFSVYRSNITISGG